MTLSPHLRQALREQLTGGRRWATPLDMACALDPRIVRTPALDLINSALVEAFDAPDARLAISMPPQEGKGLALDTPIATPTGWTLNGDLQAGDTIFGGDGRPCTVTMAHPPRLLDCYKFTFQSGATIVADGDHRWLVQDRYTKTPNGRKWIVTDTRTIAKNPRRYGVPTTPALTLPNAQLPIDPYVFGAWLGDGHSLSCRITTGTQDEQILDHIRAAEFRVTRVGSSITWKLEDPAPQTERRSPLRAKLQDLGVWGNKHIPTTYLRGSVEQRLALLQGLMDTDGSAYANESGHARCEFTTVNEQLAADVLTLARSLGIHAASHESRATLYGRDISARWRIRFTTDLPVFRLERKLARIQADSRKPRRQNGIMSVEQVPPVWTRCLTVDSPDRTYLAGRDLIPTHNTTLAVLHFIVWALQQQPDLPIVLGTYNQSLANRGGRLIRNTIEDHPEIGIRIANDNGAKHEWSIAGKAGGLVSAGRGVGISGRPAGLIVIDDPFKEGEAQSEVVREDAWSWWTEGLSARLAPGASVVVIHCMTGDTPVLMADGTERPLRDVRAGDQVATYEAGRLSTSMVMNWASQGPDAVLSVRMRSGRVVRANARHPFLTIDANGNESWLRTDQLEPGQSILATESHPKSSGLPLSTWSVSPDEVVSVEPCGTEEVFDLQIAHTENFIANGLVSHNTRWHTDDLIGRLIERDAHAGWTYLNIPAQCDDPATDPLGRREVGEFMLSARGRSQRQWEMRKLTAGSRVWNALYQGRPAPAEGGLIKRDWWQRYSYPQWEDRADGTRWAAGFDEVIISADLTFKGTATSDYVAIGVWGRRGHDAYLLDQDRRILDFVSSVHAFTAMSRRWPQAILKLVEDKANGPALISMLAKRVPGIVPVNPTGSKVTRVNAWAPLCEAGHLWIPTDDLAPWVGDYVEESAAFPNGAHDDQVDHTSQAIDRLLIRPMLTETITDDDPDDTWRIGY